MRVVLFLLITLLPIFLNSEEEVESQSSYIILSPEKYSQKAQVEWQKTLHKADIYGKNLDSFIMRFPEANQSLTALQLSSKLLELSHSIPRYHNFIQQYHGQIVATKKVHEIFELYRRQHRVSGYLDFMRRYPNTAHAFLAQQYVYALLYRFVASLNDIQEYENFLKYCPLAPQVNIVRENLKKLVVEKELGLIKLQKDELGSFFLFQKWKEEREDNFFRLWQQKVMRSEYDINAIDIYEAERFATILLEAYDRADLKENSSFSKMQERLAIIQNEIKANNQEIIESLNEELTKNIVVTTQKLIEEVALKLREKESLDRYEFFISNFPTPQALIIKDLATKKAKEEEERGIELIESEYNKKHGKYIKDMYLSERENFKERSTEIEKEGISSKKWFVGPAARDIVNEILQELDKLKNNEVSPTNLRLMQDLLFRLKIYKKFAEENFNEHFSKVLSDQGELFDKKRWKRLRNLITLWEESVQKIEPLYLRPTLENVYRCESLWARISVYENMLLYSKKSLDPREEIDRLKSSYFYRVMKYRIKQKEKIIKNNYTNLVSSFEEKVPAFAGTSHDLRSTLRKAKQKIDLLTQSFATANNLITASGGLYEVNERELKTLHENLLLFCDASYEISHYFDNNIWPKFLKEEEIDYTYFKTTSERIAEVLKNSDRYVKKSEQVIDECKEFLQNDSPSSDLDELYQSLNHSFQWAENENTPITKMVNYFHNLETTSKRMFTIKKNNFNKNWPKLCRNNYLKIYKMQLEYIERHDITVSSRKSDSVHLDQVPWMRDSTLRQSIDTTINNLQKSPSNHGIWFSSIFFAKEFIPIVTREFHHIVAYDQRNLPIMSYTPYFSQVDKVEKEALLLGSGLALSYKAKISSESVLIASWHIK